MHMAPYEYYNDFSYMEPAAESTLAGIGGFLLVFVGVFYILMFGLAVTYYVLHSAGLYTVAKRRGIRKPWLAWIPVGDIWILGSLSDQYQYVAKGKVRNRRKVLLWLALSLFAALFLVIAGAVAAGVGAVVSDTLMGSAVALMLLTYLAMLVVAVVLAVFQYIAYYDLYNSCNPETAVLYLVLSVLLNVALPFFVFFGRKKDLGMPPRKAEKPPVIEAAAFVEEAPACAEQPETCSAEDTPQQPEEL